MKAGFAGKLLSAAVVAAALAAPSQAALLTIDDRNVSSVTVTASGFDSGVYVLGNPIGLGGVTESITFVDGTYSVSGNWLDATPFNAFATRSVAMPGEPTVVTSGFFAQARSSGGFAYFLVSGGTYTGNPYFSSGPLFSFQGGTYVDTLGSLTITFITEAVNAVPEPGSLALAALGLGALPLVRRRRIG